MSFLFFVIIRLKCYNFTVSIASIDHFDLISTPLENLPRAAIPGYKNEPRAASPCSKGLQI